MDEEADGVPREELAPSVKAGTIIRHVTQYVVETRTGLSGFCAHFDRCYRDTATVHGRAAAGPARVSRSGAEC